MSKFTYGNTADVQMERTAAMPPQIAASFLSLPKLGEEVVATYRNELDLDLLELGKRMLKNGIPLEDTPKKSLLKILEEGLQKALQPHYAEITHASMVVTANEHAAELTVFSEMDAAPSYYTRKKMDDLRSISPPLAWYFWNTMEYASSVIPLLTPNWFMAIVSYVEWMGSENEEEYILEMMSEDIPEDEIDVIRLKDIESRVVRPWELRASGIKSQNIYRVRQRVHVSDAYQPLLKDLDQLRDTVQRIHEHPAYGHLSSGQNHFAIMPVLDGNDHGLWYRVIDNMYQNMMQGDNEEEFLFQITIDLTKGQDNAEWLDLLHQIGGLWTRLLHLFDTYFGD